MIKPKEKGQLNKQSGSGAIELDVYNNKESYAFEKFSKLYQHNITTSSVPFLSVLKGCSELCDIKLKKGNTAVLLVTLSTSNTSRL